MEHAHFLPVCHVLDNTSVDIWPKQFEWNELPPEIQEIIASHDFETWMCVSWKYYNMLLPLLGRGELKEFEKQVVNKGFPVQNLQFPGLPGQPPIPRPAFPRQSQIEFHQQDTVDTSLLTQLQFETRTIVLPELPFAIPVLGQNTSIPSQNLILPRPSSPVRLPAQVLLTPTPVSPQESYRRVFGILSSSQAPTLIQWRYIRDRIRRMPEDWAFFGNRLLVTKLTDIECIREHIEKTKSSPYLPFAFLNFAYFRELIRTYIPPEENIANAFLYLWDRSRMSGSPSTRLGPDEALALTTCIEYLNHLCGAPIQVQVLLKLVNSLDGTCLRYYVAKWMQSSGLDQKMQYTLAYGLFGNDHIRTVRAMLPTLSITTNIVKFLDMILEYRGTSDVNKLLQDVMNIAETINYDFRDMFHFVFSCALNGDNMERCERVFLWMLRQPNTTVTSVTLRSIVKYRNIFNDTTSIAKAASENPSVNYYTFKEIYEIRLVYEQCKQIRKYYEGLAGHYKELLHRKI